MMDETSALRMTLLATASLVAGVLAILTTIVPFTFPLFAGSMAALALVLGGKGWEVAVEASGRRPETTTGRERAIALVLATSGIVLAILAIAALWGSG